MQANDYIVKIGSTSAEFLKHPDAQDLIKQQDNLLELTIQRLVINKRSEKLILNYICIEVHHLILMIIIVI